MRRFLLLFLAAAVAVPALAVDREDAREKLEEGVIAFNDGRLGDARKAVLEALEEDPKYGIAHTLLARIFIQQNNGVSAEQQLRSAVAGGYPVENTRHLMGHALLLQGKLREGFLEVTADDVPDKYRAYAWRVRGRIHVAAGELPHARASYDEALKYGPNSTLIWSDIARFRMTAGDLGGAGEATERALSFDEKNPDALFLAGEIARNQYGMVDAIPWFERAVEADPTNVSAMLELAATQGEAGRTIDMLATIRKVIAVDGKNAQAFYLLAVIAARAKNYDLSRSLLNRVGERLDGQSNVLLLRALLNIQAENDEQAIFQLKKIVERQPGNLKARRLLGAALVRSEDYRSAIDMLRPVAMRADADSYTLTLIGRAYEQLEEREEAVWFLERAARPERGDAAPFAIPVSLSILARANAENPNNADAAVPYITQLVANGQAGPALEESIRLARLNPGAPAAHILVGDSLSALGRHGDAVAAYERAANIRFSEGTALRLVKALSRAGRDEDALRALDLFLGQNPQNVPAMLLASDYFLASEQWDKATAMLEKLRGRLGNRDVSVLNNLSWAWLNKGEGARAIAFAGAAYRISPANGAVANSYGWALFTTGYDKATGVALLEKAARKLPQNMAIQLRLGQAYAQSGRKDEAKRVLKLVLAAPNGPGRDQAKALMASL